MLGAIAEKNSGVITLIFWIVNTFICLFLIHKYTQKRHECQALRKRVDDKEVDITKQVQAFLDSQFNKTRAKKYENTQVFSHDLANFRMAYLKIEAKAISRIPDTEEYWTFLSDHLQKLLGLLRKSPFERQIKSELLQYIDSGRQKIDSLMKTKSRLANDKEYKKCVANIDSIYTYIERNNISAMQCQDYKDKVQKFVQAFLDDSDRGAQALSTAKDMHKKAKLNALQSISVNCGDESAVVDFVKAKHQSVNDDRDILDKLEKYEKESKRLAKYVDVMKDQLNGKENQKAVQMDTDRDLADEIIFANEEEIKRLSSVVRNQKFTIRELEDEVKSSKHMGAEEIAQYSGKIEQLLKSAKDSELCIKVMEAELEQLRSRVADPAGSEVSRHQLDMLNHEVINLKDEIFKMEGMNANYASLIKFVFEALAAESIEVLCILLHEAVANMRYTPSLLVKAGPRVIDMSDDELLEVNRAIINSMRLNEFNRRRKGQLIFKMSNISGVLVPVDEQDVSEDRCDHVVNLIRISNAAIDKLTLTQASVAGDKRIQSSIELLQQASYGIDKLMETYTNSVKSNISDNMNLLKSSARSRGYNASQISTIHAAETEILNQLRSDDIIRHKLRRQVLKVITELQRK